MVKHRLMAAMFFPFCYTVAVLKDTYFNF